MSLTETFYKTIAITVINKYGKVPVLDISTMFGRIYLLLFEGSLEMDFLDIDLTKFFGVPNFGNT